MGKWNIYKYCAVDTKTNDLVQGTPLKCTAF